MKYPITPEYLASAPDPIVRLFTDLESEILADICRRFKLSGEATESAIAQIKILQEQGVDLKDIEKVIKNTLKLSERELEEIFDRAVKRNQAFYDELIQKANIVNADYKGIDEAISAIQRQTHDDFVNLTQSLGFAVRSGGEVKFLPVAKTYQRVLDDAAAQVMSGAFDYNTAIRNAVKRLSDSGLQMVDYSTGWHNRVDVAARRAVMTGVSQLSAQYAEKSAEMLETDYREVTAHSGARDKGEGWQNHKAWQGKVYSVKSGDKYPSIYEVCGWGMVDGLEGANCRHHHFPFVEGISERTYTDEQLENIDRPPFEYQGKTYTSYEATQKQRQIETAMRKCKREIICFKAAGMEEDYQDSSIRLRRLSTEYKAFSEAAGLKTQPERGQVQGFGYKEASRASASERRIDANVKSSGTKSTDNPSGTVKHAGTVDFNDKSAVFYQLELAEKATKDFDFEVNCSVTTDGRVWLVSGEKATVNPTLIPYSLKGSYSYHNHPKTETWYSFSAEDAAFFIESGEEYSKASDDLFEYIMIRKNTTLVSDYETVYNRFREIQRTDVMSMKWDGLIDPDIDEYHETMKRLSKEYGFDYMRRRRNGD